MLITLKKNTVKSGKLLKGEIRLSLVGALRAGSLVLMINGVEEYSGRALGDGGGEAGIESSFLKSELLIREFETGGMLRPGLYLFPFEVQMPAYAPSSYRGTGEGETAQIRYFLEAELRASGAAQVSALLECAKPFYYQQVIPIRYRVVREFRLFAHLLQCVPCGCTSVRLEINKTCLYRGEVLILQFEIDNRGSSLSLAQTNSQVLQVRTIQDRSKRLLAQRRREISHHAHPHAVAAG